jgi:hypothetical protein
MKMQMDSPSFTPLPPPAGPLTEALFESLRQPPHELLDLPAAGDDALGGADHHLALYVCWELAFRGWAGIDSDWEWEPSLIVLRTGLERAFEQAVLDGIDSVPDAVDGDVPTRLRTAVEADDSPSVARFLAQQGTVEQIRELLAHRSAYHLKEVDPHVRTIPRLPYKAKAALVEVLTDEYGGGRPEYLHAELFRKAMDAFGLDGTENAYVACLPGVTLATVNLMTLFGAHSRWRGALVGHLAATEMTSSEANRRYARAARRVGFDSHEATHFFDEHVEADAIHDVVCLHDLAGGLAEAEPELADSIVFGARALMLVEERLARHLLGAWEVDRSSLRRPLETVAPVAA